MHKIQDRFVAGMVAGLGANFVKQAIEWTLFLSGFSKEVGAHKAAGFFLSSQNVRTPLGTALGAVADNGIAGALGVVASYLLSFTGKDHALLKGLSIGNFTWNVAYGVAAQLGATSVKPDDPKTTLASWISHTAFGVTKAKLLLALSEPELFEPQYHSIGQPPEQTNLLAVRQTRQ